MSDSFVKTFNGGPPKRSKAFYGTMLIRIDSQSRDICVYKNTGDYSATEVSDFLRSTKPHMRVVVICPEDKRQEMSSFIQESHFDIKYKTLSPNETAEIIIRPDDLKISFKLNAATETHPEPGQNTMVADPNKKVSLLIVDDSPTIRKVIHRAVTSADKNIEIVGQTGNPLEVEELIQTLKPDVMTLDINMPEMKGNELLAKIFPDNFVPTIVISALDVKESESVMDALENGAMDYIQKPSRVDFSEFGGRLAKRLRAVAGNTQMIAASGGGKSTTLKSVSVDPAALVAIGASTGGTEAIKAVLEQLPATIPPTVVVLHIPEYFSKCFADRLNSLVPFTVKEAVDYDELKNDLVLVAPGGQQMKVIKYGSKYVVRVEDGEKVSGHMPSVDYMFNALARLKGKKISPVILTGMGKDGAAGLKLLHDKGYPTIGQNQETSVVYGMPKAAKTLGAVSVELPLGDIAEKLVEQFIVDTSKPKAS